MNRSLIFILIMGFSVGDELGFTQALSNVESDRRRSADGTAAIEVGRADSGKGDTGEGASTGRSAQSGGGWRAMKVPPFKPIAPALPTEVPKFAALPPSIARIPIIPPRQAAPQAFQSALHVANRRFQVVVPNMTEQEIKSGLGIGSVEVVPNGFVSPTSSRPSGVPPHTLTTRTSQMQVDLDSPSPILNGHSVQSLAQASNISVEALAAAIRVRQQYNQSLTTTTSTTTTTTERPRTRVPTVRPKYSLVGPNRVMNAPKEYYPVSYDKNYDDNFTSKVELPDTTFSCGDQKHFPGLYADEDLGCMVFHVCAFTDDGLVMKSFLCPESTLFDQTILKCNWWFYVDCKSSKKLYDSNIPISKSYQLMKALAFFSSYKNQTSSNAT